jgi:hypothetical protein
MAQCISVQQVLLELERLTASDGLRDFSRNGRNAFLFYESGVLPSLTLTDTTNTDGADVCRLYTHDLDAYLELLQARKKPNTVRNYVQHLLKGLEHVPCLQRALSADQQAAARTRLLQVKQENGAAVYGQRVAAVAAAAATAAVVPLEQQPDLPLQDAEAAVMLAAAAAGGATTAQEAVAAAATDDDEEEDDMGSQTSSRSDHLASLDASLAEAIAHNQQLVGQLQEQNEEIKGLVRENAELKEQLRSTREQLARLERILPHCLKDQPPIVQALFEVLLREK